MGSSKLVQENVTTLQNIYIMKLRMKILIIDFS